MKTINKVIGKNIHDLIMQREIMGAVSTITISEPINFS